MNTFFLIIKARKWKNGYLQQYCEYYQTHNVIGWFYTDFKNEEDFNKWNGSR